MVPHNIFGVLTVCTGNIARSPLTQQLLLSKLQGAPGQFSVASAGTAAVVGSPMTRQAAALSLRLGSGSTDHVARAVTSEIIDSVDLVLTATRAHRSDIVALLPRASRYTFTVRQFARLLDSLDASILALADESIAERARRLVAEAAAQRGFLPPLAQASDDDVEDPFRLSDEVYDRVGVQIDQATARIAAALMGERPAFGGILNGS